MESTQVIFELSWWIKFVEVPVLMALIGWLIKTRSAVFGAIDVEREKLNEFKVECAKEYVTIITLRNVRDELIDRINELKSIIKLQQGGDD